MPGFASNLYNVMDECGLLLDQRGTSMFMIPAVPSMFEEYIDVEIMLSAQVTRTRVKAMKP